MPQPIINIAFVDDHESVRTGIATFICRTGRINVQIEAKNGKDFLQKLSKADTVPDICLLDINMPVMNGYETQMELTKNWPQVKTLVLTSHDAELAICRMIGYGAKGFLVKSCNASEIEEAIISIYNKGIYHSELAGSSLFSAIRHKQIKLPNFTEQEMDVLRLCSTQLTYAEIAKKLDVSEKSVEGTRNSLFRKMNVATRTALVLYAVELGLIPHHAPANPAL